MNKILYTAIILAISSNIFAGNAPKSTNNTNAKKGTMQKQATAPKIAYLNFQKIMTVDPRALHTVAEEWQDLYKNIEKVVEPASKEFETLTKKYKESKTEFENLQNSKMATREALQKKYEEVAKLEMELRQRYEEREHFLQDELAKAQNVLTPKVQAIVNKIKDAQGWDLIVRGEIVLVENEKFDITDEVLKQLNADYAIQKKANAEADKKANKQTVA